MLRRGGPVRIHVRAKDLRRPGRAEPALTAVDAALPHVTPDDVRAGGPAGGLTHRTSHPEVPHGWSGEDCLGSLTHQWLWRMACRGCGDARVSCPR